MRGPTEEWPEILDSAAFFPGYGPDDVKQTEPIVISLDIQKPHTWAREIPRQAAVLAELFLARGYRLVGVARMEVSDQQKPVWVALLKEESQP
ncbi:MAG: hypothetical protein ABIY63_13415 [Fibrobacteria bacterium]